MEENRFTAILPKLSKYGYKYQLDKDELIIKTNKLAYLKVKYPLIIIVSTIAFFTGLLLLYTNILATKRQIIDWLEESNS